jgi:transglutaminase-like putative cysteine protease
MIVRRREFLLGGAALSAGALLPQAVSAQPAAAFAPRPGAWRRFDIVTRLEIAKPKGVTQAWVPLPSIEERDWTRPMGNLWRANTDAVFEHRESAAGLSMVHAAWPASEAKPYLEVRSRIAVRDRAVDLAKRAAAELTPRQRASYTAPTKLKPLDGVVKKTADRITAGAASELDKARRIYDWIVENTARNPKTRGCGLGDIASMLHMGDLTGKCADLNALYVGLARAAGLPARDLYGVRIAPSRFGYKSLGANSRTITSAQHCRAEVFVTGIGWIPVDPADVRKVMLEEPPGNRRLDDDAVKNAHKALFGSWETNWLAYNDANDVPLPGSRNREVGFLMYPQAETANGLIDCLDPKNFKYTITTTEV